MYSKEWDTEVHRGRNNEGVPKNKAGLVLGYQELEHERTKKRGTITTARLMILRWK